MSAKYEYAACRLEDRSGVLAEIERVSGCLSFGFGFN